VLCGGCSLVVEVWGREEACAMKDEAEFAFFIGKHDSESRVRHPRRQRG